MEGSNTEPKEYRKKHMYNNINELHVLNLIKATLMESDVLMMI